MKYIKKEHNVEITSVSSIDGPLIVSSNVLGVLKAKFSVFNEDDECIYLNYLKNDLELRKYFTINDRDLSDLECKISCIPYSKLTFTAKETKQLHGFGYLLTEIDHPSNSKNRFGESKYHLTGNEKEISLEAGKSRNYEEYFDEC